MNRIAITIAVVISSMQVVWACPKNSVEWKGNCAIEIKPESAPSVKPSDEKPPRSGMPSWQDPRIHVIEIESWLTSDAHHPKDCATNCLWSGIQCYCNRDKDSAKLPK